MPVPAGPSSVISVDEVKLRLRKTSSADDDKIQSMIDAAEAEYTEYVGPISGTVTEYFDGGGTALVLASADATAVTVAEYDDGTAITTDDLTVRNGIVRWGYGTAGRFTYGTQNVAITYTVGSLPASHREAILADIAGYFAATQRSGEPRTTGDGYADGFYSTPTTLFPRIRALALPGIA